MTLFWEKHRDLSGGVPAESGKGEVNFFTLTCKWHFGAMALARIKNQRKKDRYIVRSLMKLILMKITGG
jgi:hypothetical protein